MAGRLRDRLAAVIRGDDSGFTVLEVVVSFTLFVTVATGAMYGIVNALKASHATQQRVAAANVAQRFVAEARANAAKTINTPGKTIIVPVGDGTSVGRENFTVVQWVTFEAPDATQCSPGTTFTVNVIVEQSETGKFLARNDSVVACPPA